MNGNGNDEKPSHESRIGDIEAIQRRRLADHEEFRQEHKRLLIAQVLLTDAQRRLTEAQKETDRKLAELAAAQARSEESGKRADERVSSLVIAIGELIQRLPQPRL